MILVIDNYDSFTYNLVQLIGKFEPDILIARNDKITIEEIKENNPERIVISPGPGKPEDSKISIDAIKALGEKVPILGVCLGHQGIAQVFGAAIIHAPVLMHGKSSLIKHDGKTIFKNIEQNFSAARYHSLVIDPAALPDDLEISALTFDNVIMGVRHKYYPIEGIQFHPESVLTECGEKLIKNWLDIY